MDESGLDEIDKITDIDGDASDDSLSIREPSSVCSIVATSKSREMENEMKMIRAKRKGLLLLATREVSMINSAM